MGRLVFLFFRRGGCQGNKLLIVFNLKQKKAAKKIWREEDPTHTVTHTITHTHTERERRE